MGFYGPFLASLLGGRVGGWEGGGKEGELHIDMTLDSVKESFGYGDNNILHGK